MSTIQEYRNPLLIGLVGVVIALVIYMFGYSPQASKLTTLQTKEASLQSQASQLQAQLNTLKSEKQQLSANCADLAKISTQIPSVESPADLAAEESSFYTQLTDLVNASGTSIPTFAWTANTGNAASSASSSSSSTSSSSSSSVVAVPVGMTVTGNYQQMSAFVSGLDSFPRLFVIQSFNLGFGVTGSTGATSSSSSAGTSSSASATAPPLWTGQQPTAGTYGPYSLAMQGSIYYTTTPNALSACQKAVAAG